jgi:hypothetical protein
VIDRAAVSLCDTGIGISGRLYVTALCPCSGGRIPMTVIDEASPRNGSVVHSQRAATPGAVITAPASSPAPPSPSRAESRPGRRRRGRQKRQEDHFVDVEAVAAAESAEGFFRGWLIVATAISVVANVAHAWLTAPADIRVGAAVASLVAAGSTAGIDTCRFQADQGTAVWLGVRHLTSCDGSDCSWGVRVELRVDTCSGDHAGHVT